MEERDVVAVHDLVMRAFETAIAPAYAPGGVEAFTRYASQVSIARRMTDNHLALVAEREGMLLGVVEVRDLSHISMLFVDPSAQRGGVGTRLLDAALALCVATDPRPTAVTVNSAPDAVPFYLRAGFDLLGPANDEHGIVSVPMSRPF